MPNSEARIASRDIDDLCLNSSSFVRAALAANLRTPADTLRVLAADSNLSVKLAAAFNPSCPLDSLEKLAESTDWPIRLGLSAELDLCEEILQALVKHRNPYLRSQARQALTALEMEKQLKLLNLGRTIFQHKLGALLIEANRLNKIQLNLALELGEKYGLKLGQVLVRVGLIDSKTIVEALQIQWLIQTGETDLASGINRLASF